MKKYTVPLLMLAIFETIAVSLWLSKSNIFYLFNFSYIGISLTLGLILFTQHKPYARHIVQFLVGGYMLIYLGIICGENMQIEGFWYYLFLGVFEAATIHYAVAKIFGPLLFGRGWCGYACWTAMVLDLLPYKIPEQPRRKNLGKLRYLLFTLALLFVASLFLFEVENKDKIMWYSFLIGNTVYYIAGIALAFAFHDNRAFCKYLCPITAFLKVASRFSFMRIGCDEKKCISCGKCRRVCPMNVEPNLPFAVRANRTECILCLKCVESCPKGALELSLKTSRSKRPGGKKRKA